jgi:hypothetical protein
MQNLYTFLTYIYNFACVCIVPVISYTIRVTTGDQSDAGTDAKAYVVLIGNEAASEKIPLELVQQSSFSPGITETFSVEAADVGKVTITHLKNILF